MKETISMTYTRTGVTRLEPPGNSSDQLESLEENITTGVLKYLNFGLEL